jgi:glycosyltransferase involved in cell wall biosynthesis
MKIVIINISDRIGGSGIATYRVAEALRKDLHNEVFYLVRTKSVNHASIYTTTANKFLSKIERLFNIGMNLLGLQYLWLPFSPRFIYKKLKQEKPDVIWLNNLIGGYFVIGDLIKISQIASTVWTMHDMWPFTANASHTFGDESWKNMKAGKNEKNIYPAIGLPTGNWLIKRKKKIYDCSSITFIAPSEWMYNLSIQSPLLKKKKIELIPHGIDTDIFKPMEKFDLRKKMYIPEHAPVIMFSAEKLKNNIFKGGADLIKILNYLNHLTKEKIYVLLAGKDNLENIEYLKNIQPVNLGYINSDERMSEAYNTCDVFVYPTKADSVSLVLMEAIACGIPCVSFAMGGTVGIIKDGYNGFSIPNGDYKLAAEKTFELLQNKNKYEEFSKNARTYAVEKFNLSTIAKRYQRLFENIQK